MDRLRVHSVCLLTKLPAIKTTNHIKSNTLRLVHNLTSSWHRSNPARRLYNTSSNPFVLNNSSFKLHSLVCWSNNRYLLSKQRCYPNTLLIRSSVQLKPALKEDEEQSSSLSEHSKTITKNSANSILYSSSTGLVKPLSEGSLLAVPDVNWQVTEPMKAGQVIGTWLKLAKFRLTSLVAMTTLAGYYMGAATFEPHMCAIALIGTALTSSSAAALNQFLEVPYDSQMIRTKNRPLVMKQVSPLHAFSFALATGVTGIGMLSLAVNPLTGTLGALNLLLYSFVYTPMKRFNIVNTWVGSLVGAIPPIMGYTAATGSIDLAAISLGLILYSWQFPHFNALSWNIKNDYARAGYRMMVVTHPDLCVRTALRHSILLLLYCEMMCFDQINLTTWTFGFDSLPVNLYLIYLAYKFHKNPNSKTSRTLFKYSLVHLPVLIALMLISKKKKRDQDSDHETLAA